MIVNLDTSKDLIKSKLLEYINEITTPSSGKNQYICPLCGSGTGKSHTGAFTVYPDTNTYKCFACGITGDIFSLYQAKNNVSFKIALQELSKKYNIPLEQEKPVILEEREHIYTNETGNILAKKVIKKLSDGSKKTCWFGFSRGEYKVGFKCLDGKQIPVYHVDKLINSNVVYIVEGEKDVETLEKMGLTATTSPHGANTKWNKDYNKYFINKTVIILSDNDIPGEKHAQEIAEILIDVAKSVYLIPSKVIYSDLKQKGDISDIVDVVGLEQASDMLSLAIEKAKPYTKKYAPQYDDTGILTVHNLKEFLKAYNVSVKYNEISHEVEYNRINEKATSLLDAIKLRGNISANIGTWIFDALKSSKAPIKNYNINHIYTTLEAIANMPESSYNPVLELIEATKWDGIDYLEQVYNMFKIDKTDILSRSLFKRWFMQCICGLHNSDSNKPFALDLVLVFKGKQGVGKTRFLEKIALDGEYFAEGASVDVDNKDIVKRITSVWICELGEIGSTLKRDVNKIKAFITLTWDEYRTPYARKSCKYQRGTSFCATTNDEQFLVDETGNRRWGVVPLKDDLKIDYVTQIKPFNALQFWSQINKIVHDEMKKYNKSYAEVFRLDENEKNLLNARNLEHTKLLKGEQEVADILAMELEPESGCTIHERYITVTDFIKDNDAVLRKYTAEQVGRALTKLGYPVIRKKIKGDVNKFRLLPWKVITGTNKHYTERGIT